MDGGRCTHERPVTGGNRGIGFEACRQLARHGMRVVLASRDESKGRAAAKRLRDEGGDVRHAPPDVTDEGSVERFADFLRRTYGRLDVLVNNTGAFLDRGEGGATSEGSIVTLIETLRRTIVNVSSGRGQLSEMNGGWPAYRVSKTALNALTRTLAGELKGTSIRSHELTAFLKPHPSPSQKRVVPAFLVTFSRT